MIFEYREAFSLRDEIGTWPNIDIDIDVTDKTSFLLDPTMSEKKIKESLIRK